MTLLICPVRPGEENQELRYALRSWEENLILPNLYLTTVGYCPSWLTPDHHIEGNRYEAVKHNVWDNIALASEWADQGNGLGQAIYMNDDFFCMDPVLRVPVVRRDKTLAEHAAMYANQTGLWFPRSLALTADWLAGLGYPHPWSYDLHRPLPASPGAMIRALARWDGGFTGDIPQWRTVYGVLNEIEAIPVEDVKLGVGKPNPHSPWISTSDSSWRKYGRQISQRFQKPSRWEKS